MSQFDGWLRELAAANKGGFVTRLPDATRTLAWSTPVVLPGDWTGAVLEGTISASPDAASALATFAVSGPVVAGGTSTFTISLASGTGANTTGSLPADGTGAGFIELPYMLRLTPSGGVKDTLFGGLFPLLGKA